MGVGALFALIFGCFLIGHAVVLSGFALVRPLPTRAPPRARRRESGARYAVEFVGAEAGMLTAAIELGVIRLSAFSAMGTLITLTLGLVWWEVWFYVGHRLLHTRWLYPLHRPHHAAVGVHGSLCFGAAETVLLSSGFYVPLGLASRLQAVS